MKLFEVITNSVVLHLCEAVNDVDHLEQEASRIGKILDELLRLCSRDRVFLLTSFADRKDVDYDDRFVRYISNVREMLQDMPNASSIQRIQDLGLQILQNPVSHERFFRSVFMRCPKDMVQMSNLELLGEYNINVLVEMMRCGDQIDRFPELMKEISKEELVQIVCAVFSMNGKQDELKSMSTMLISRIDSSIPLEERFKMLKVAICHKQDLEIIRLLLSKISGDCPIGNIIEMLEETFVKGGRGKSFLKESIYCHDLYLVFFENQQFIEEDLKTEEGKDTVLEQIMQDDEEQCFTMEVMEKMPRANVVQYLARCDGQGKSVCQHKIEMSPFLAKKRVRSLRAKPAIQS